MVIIRSHIVIIWSLLGHILVIISHNMVIIKSKLGHNKVKDSNCHTYSITSIISTHTDILTHQRDNTLIYPIHTNITGITIKSHRQRHYCCLTCNLTVRVSESTELVLWSNQIGIAISSHGFLPFVVWDYAN